MFLVTLLALPEVTDLNRRQGQFGIFMFRLFLDQCPAAGVYFDHHRYSHMMCQRRAHKWGYAGLDITLEARSTRRNRGGRFFLGSVKSVLQLFKSGYFQQWQCPQIINSVFVYPLLNVLCYRLSTWRGHISCWNILIEASHSLSAVLPAALQAVLDLQGGHHHWEGRDSSSIKQHARAWQRWLAGPVQTCRLLRVEVIESI